MSVKITSRDLIAMNYNPADGDLFRKILETLTEHVKKSGPDAETYQSQIVWIKENFPK